MELCLCRLCRQSALHHLQSGKYSIPKEKPESAVISLPSFCKDHYKKTFYCENSSTTGGLWKIGNIHVLFYSHCTQYISIDFNVEKANFPVISKKVSWEIVVSISTRGHCECTGCVVVSMNLNKTAKYDINVDKERTTLN